VKLWESLHKTDVGKYKLHYSEETHFSKVVESFIRGNIADYGVRQLPSGPQIHYTFKRSKEVNYRKCVFDTK
jgi:hypothetical protein